MCVMLVLLALMLGALSIEGGHTAANAAPAATAHQLYLPTVLHDYPWTSPLGVQTGGNIGPGSVRLQQLQELQVGWVRISRIEWKQLQPIEGGPIHVELLASLDQQLRAMRRANIKVNLVIAAASPRWATIHPTGCSAIRPDRFAAFAAFLRLLVERYSQPEFGVHDWELGNEPDVDWRLVGEEAGIGCWGDIQDPYYGGRTYGEMLKVVSPAIRAADPAARIWVGGLLLDRPDTEPKYGRPEFFLKGILAAGAAPYFDVLPYHAYPPYFNAVLDSNDVPFSSWAPYGGISVGKARYLRSIMQSYGVSKPLVVNESALMCSDGPNFVAFCSPPDGQFYRVQASYLVRTLSSLLAEQIETVMWYRLDQPDWRYTSLFDATQQPRLSYTALYNLSRQITGATSYQPLAMPEYEGVRATRGQEAVDIVWTRGDDLAVVVVPSGEFVSASDRDGRPLTPSEHDDGLHFLVGFDPIYITRRPAPASDTP